MRSIVPDNADEIISDTWQSGARRSAFYALDGQRVGYRSWAEEGYLELEYALRDGQMHGPFRSWHENGQPSVEACYERGKEHGASRQYDERGALIGSYTMAHGTGTDLWYAAAGVLAEEREYQDGLRHGYERWWNCDNATVWQEEHYWRGEPHGIFRRWNERGALRRGYPRYFVAGRQVARRKYERARRDDPTLPPFTLADNAPGRRLPAAVALTSAQAGAPKRG